MLRSYRSRRRWRRHDDVVNCKLDRHHHHRGKNSDCRCHDSNDSDRQCNCHRENGHRRRVPPLPSATTTANGGSPRNDSRVGFRPSAVRRYRGLTNIEVGTVVVGATMPVPAVPDSGCALRHYRASHAFNWGGSLKIYYADRIRSMTSLCLRDVRILDEPSNPRETGCVEDSPPPSSLYPIESFGVILLELLTGKPPVSDGIDLAKWALSYSSKLDEREQILDSRVSKTSLG